MKKTRWPLYLIFGLFFYLLFLIVEMPAAWFAWGLHRYTQGALRLDPASGTLWHGNGRLVVYYPQTRPHDLGQAAWRINPLWLLAGRVQLSLQANHQDKRIKTALGLAANRLLLKDTEADFPAAFAAQLYTPLTLISPQGTIRLRATEVILTPGMVNGAATLEWLNASSGLSVVQPLGDYRVEITGSGDVARITLATLRGDLEFTGKGEWQARSGQLQINGSALPRARQGEMESLLNMIGNDQGGGKRTLNINTRLPPVFPSN